MSNEAKVRIGGDSSGAQKATDQTRKGLESVGKSAVDVGDLIKNAADKGAAAEKKYEAEVFKTIQRLKQKEITAKATEEAMRRLGQVPAGSTTGGSTRGNFSTPPPTVGGVTAGGIAQAASRMGGAAGGEAGKLAASLGSAVPAIGALGVVAMAGGLALKLLTSSSEEHTRAIGDGIKLEYQRQDAIETAIKSLSATVLGAAGEGGAGLREAIARGGSIAGVQDIAQKTGLSAGDASKVSATMSDLDAQSKKVIIQAVRDAIRLGVDPVKTAQELRASSKGGLGDMDREAALRNAGNLFDNYRGQSLVQSLGAPDGDLNRLQGLSEFAARGSQAGFKTLGSDDAFNAANKVTAEDAKRTSDPVTAALGDLAKTMKREIELLEGMAKGEHPLVRALNDLSASMRGGQGSYSKQAGYLRELANGAGR